MQTIHKQTLELKDEQVIRLPVGALLLSCQNQNGELTLWYSFDAGETEDEAVTFYVIGTGQLTPDTFPGRFFKTVQVADFVWHVFFKPLPPLQRGKPIVANPNDAGASKTRGNDNGGA